MARIKTKVENVLENKYYFYSKSQEDSLREVNNRFGKEFVCPKVLVKGKWKKYTEDSDNDTHNRTDSKLVTSGKNKMIRIEDKDR